MTNNIRVRISDDLEVAEISNERVVAKLLGKEFRKLIKLDDQCWEDVVEINGNDMHVIVWKLQNGKIYMMENELHYD
jgi:hypothetical protein